MVPPRPSLVVAAPAGTKFCSCCWRRFSSSPRSVSTVLEPVIVALLGGVLVYALWTSRAAIGMVWVATGLALACVLTSAVAPVWLGSSRVLYALVSITLSIGAIGAIVTHLTRRRSATSATLAGAVAIYLLLGLIFADVYMCLAQLRRRRLLRANGVAERRRLPLLQLHHPDHRRFRGPDRGHRPRSHARRGRGVDGSALPRHHRRLHRRPDDPAHGRDGRTARV